MKLALSFQSAAGDDKYGQLRLSMVVLVRFITGLTQCSRPLLFGLPMVSCRPVPYAAMWPISL